MADGSALALEYTTHERVRRLRDVLRYHLEEIALEFDRWGEPRVYGPGMYVVLVAGTSVEPYADPMGENRWPEEAVRDPFADSTAFAGAAREVALTCDGAVVMSVDGVVNRQLVRFRSVETDSAEYAPWMGSRHMSALDVSTHSDIVTALTLSQESGRVTVFEDGEFDSTPRGKLGGRWRLAE